MWRSKYLRIKPKATAFYVVIVLSAVARSHSPCTGDESCVSHPRLRKYLLYDVNPGEGFNLRRDVYMRVARLVASLNMDLDPEEQWVLVLPPWGPLYHWRSKDVGSQIRIKWKEFFDIKSLAAYVPVMELEDFRGKHCLVLRTLAVCLLKCKKKKNIIKHNESLNRQGSVISVCSTQI